MKKLFCLCIVILLQSIVSVSIAYEPGDQPQLYFWQLSQTLSGPPYDTEYANPNEACFAIANQGWTLNETTRADHCINWDETQGGTPRCFNEVQSSDIFCISQTCPDYENSGSVVWTEDGGCHEFCTVQNTHYDRQIEACVCDNLYYDQGNQPPTCELPQCPQNSSAESGAANTLGESYTCSCDPGYTETINAASGAVTCGQDYCEQYPNSYECRDTDGNGDPDISDPDDDGDGIPDDEDGDDDEDGIPDTRDPDSPENGKPDADDDGIPDHMDGDDDDDGINDTDDPDHPDYGEDDEDDDGIPDDEDLDFCVNNPNSIICRQIENPIEEYCNSNPSAFICRGSESCDPVTDPTCEVEDGGTCPTGYSYNSSTDQCIPTPGSITMGTCEADTIDCEGDPIQCAAIQLEFTEYCENNRGDPQEFVDGLLTDVGEGPAEETIDAEASLEYTSESASCPGDKQVALGQLGNITIPLTPICQLASMLRPLFLLIGFFVGGRITYTAFFN